MDVSLVLQKAVKVSQQTDTAAEMVKLMRAKCRSLLGDDHSPQITIDARPTLSSFFVVMEVRAEWTEDEDQQPTQKPDTVWDDDTDWRDHL